LKHTNNGKCLKCEQIVGKYPGINNYLWFWFRELQKENPEVHISCAGRGEQEQNELFQRKASKARWGQSAHNYNCAIDVFVMIPGVDTIYPKSWFETVLMKKLNANLNWYGRLGSPFYELPHIEVNNWKELLEKRKIKLVE